MPDWFDQHAPKQQSQSPPQSTGDDDWFARNAPGKEQNTDDPGFFGRLGQDAAAIPGMIRHPVKALEGATAARRGEQDKAKEAWEQGEHVEAAGHALAGAIPFIGPAAARAGEDIGEGRYRAGAADVAELALPYAKYAKDIPIPSTVSRAAKVATRPGVLLKGGETAASGAYATHSMWGAMWLTKNLGGLAKMVREEWSKTGAPETDTAMREDLAHSLRGKKFDNLTPGEQSSIRVLIDRIKNPSKTEEAGPKGLAEHQKQPGWWRNPADRPKPSVRESMGLKDPEPFSLTPPRLLLRQDRKVGCSVLAKT